MRHLFYTIRYLLHTYSNNLIKVVSLSLGLIVGLTLFTQVAFEMSFDNFYPDKDQLYIIGVKGNINGSPLDESEVINYPYASTLLEEFSEVESATCIFHYIGENKFKTEENNFQAKTLYADSLFFNTLGFRVLAGNPDDLALPQSIFVSESFARKAFGSTDQAIGKKCMEENNTYSVAGVFADIPKNCHLQFDVIVSISHFTGGGSPGWQRMDAFTGYVKLAKGADPDSFKDKILTMRKKHYDVDASEKSGWHIEHFLKPVTTLHSGNKEIKRTCLILSLLAFAILFSSAMNFVLISISSLARRAKSVGIHKCNGASGKNIFLMFIYETLILIVISILLAGLAILAFREQIEMLIKTDLSSIFTLENVWVGGVILIILLIITGIIPARIFSSIPVTQVFHTYSDNKKRWKKILLFTQFAGITFLLTLLFIIISQYQLLLNKDAGYSKENIITANLWGVPNEKLNIIKEEFSRFPEIQSLCQASSSPNRVSSGQPVQDKETKKNLFGTKVMQADKDYINTLQMKLAAGRTFNDGSVNAKEIIVNETFARNLQTTNPIGYKVMYFNEIYTICGVIKDFQYVSFFEETPPIGIFPPIDFFFMNLSTLIIKINKPVTPALLQKFNNKLFELTQNKEYYLQPYDVTYAATYTDTRLFRNSVSVTAIIMLLITLLGLFGYVTDEVHRRRKEIAIRKVNGATATNILLIISKDISYMAIPALIAGFLGAYAVGTEWLQQFVVRIPLNASLFIASGVAVLVIIYLCMVIRAWSTANENPVDSIKSE